MIDISISEAAELLRRKKISPVDLATACLDRIERLNPVLNAFITVTHESAMAGARVAAKTRFQRGQWRGPLHEIPIGLKDSDRHGWGSHHLRHGAFYSRTGCQLKMRMWCNA